MSKLFTTVSLFTSEDKLWLNTRVCAIVLLQRFFFLIIKIIQLIIGWFINLHSTLPWVYWQFIGWFPSWFANWFVHWFLKFNQMIHPILFSSWRQSKVCQKKDSQQHQELRKSCNCCSILCFDCCPNYISECSQICFCNLAKNWVW